MDAYPCCSGLQKTQNLTVMSHQIIQNEEQKKLESLRFYCIPNPANTSRIVHRGKPYEGTVKCMHFQMVRIIIILLFMKMIK